MQSLVVCHHPRRLFAEAQQFEVTGDHRVNFVPRPWPVGIFL
jgi:hypothetical protein